MPLREQGVRDTTQYTRFNYMRKRKKRSVGHFNSVTACISTTMVLILVGTVVFFATMADNLGRTLRENFTVEVLLDDSITHQDRQQLRDYLNRQPYTRLVKYMSKEEATKQQAEALDTDPNDFLGYSPIPASFEVHLKAEYANSDSLHLFMPPIKKKSFVSDVVYPEDLMDNVNHNIKNVSIALLVVALLLAFISISLINNTMRLSVARRKHAIQTMKLVGAKWSFIRKPFLWQAFWIGLISSALSDGVLFAGMHALTLWDAQIAGLITPFVMLSTLLFVPVFGIFLIILSAFFSVNKHLQMSRNESYLY